MSYWKRMFSADYRRGLSAEAAGDYAEAARAYALCGEQAKVAEMHLLRAERAPSPEGKLQELRAAVRWADPEDPEGIEARRRIARALWRWARSVGVVSDADRQVVREAAALFESSGDPSGAGECYELIGDELAAAEAYQRAGDVERLEAVLAREETRRRKLGRVTEAYEEYRLHLDAGARDLALLALRQCVDEAKGTEQAGYRRELEALEARVLSAGQCVMRLGGVLRRYVGAFPLCIGREGTCELVLRDAGVSRRHCEVEAGPMGGFVLRDLGSRNGTQLGGLTIDGALALVGEGEIGVGEHCTLHFASGDELGLEVVRGLDRGMKLLASSRPFVLGAGFAAGVGAGFEGGTGPGFELCFVDRRPRLRSRSGEPLRLNGRLAAAEIQILVGDVVELGPLRLEVE